jgi:hypothetical protein
MELIMIKVTLDIFVRTQNAAVETSEKISKFPHASFVEDYKLHLKCLNKLLTELEIVPKLTLSESLDSSNQIYIRMQELKTILV